MCYVKKLEYSNIGIPCGFAIFVNAFCNKVVAICRENVLYSWEKNCPCISQGMRKPKLLIALSKFLKIMCHGLFFSELCELCALS